MRVYTDVSNLLKVDYISGIQRVVREVVSRMIERDNIDLALLAYSERYGHYSILDPDVFMDCFKNNKDRRSELDSGVKIHLTELGSGDVFFDLDSVWNLPVKRSRAYWLLKDRGVKVVTYVYDIIPVNYPQFCHLNTVFNFLNYIGAVIRHCDHIIVSAEATLRSVDKLCDKLGVLRLPGSVSWLGADLKNEESEGTLDARVKDVIGQTRYVLMVGTIEPRKNHRLILDAFDSRLFGEGYALVIAGRIGWDSEETEQRIKEHPLYKKQLYLLEGLDDANIAALYRNAVCVAVPSFEEGFGLPIIEAFQHKTPVLASDIPVFNEVGGRGALYFAPDDPDAFTGAFHKLADEETVYEEKKKEIEGYEAVSWDETVTRIEEALSKVGEDRSIEIPEKLKQIVYLSARPEALLETLPFVEHFMEFIEEAVISCPDSMVEELDKDYKGRLNLKYITDSELLKGDPLPEDHSHRNFFLRTRLMEREELDDVFIMSDDDYRPMVEIRQPFFVKGGRYIGYHCYMLKDWKGDQHHPSSFDRCMKRTYEFLKGESMPARMYESHMPQVIDKRVFRELIREYPDIPTEGLSEWSTYFNYLADKYPDMLETSVHKTLSWPGAPSDWPEQEVPNEYLFENYYDILYQKGRVFEGLSETFHRGIENENIIKIARAVGAKSLYQRGEAAFKAYSEGYEAVYGERPNFAISLENRRISVTLPKYVVMKKGIYTRLPFLMEYPEVEDRAVITIGYSITDSDENVVMRNVWQNTLMTDRILDYPVKASEASMSGVLTIEVKYKKWRASESAVVKIMD